MGVSLNDGTPISHPKMIIFSRKTHGIVGETHHFGKPPYIPRAPNDLYFGRSPPKKTRSFELPPMSPERRQEAGKTKLETVFHMSMRFWWEILRLKKNTKFDILVISRIWYNMY